MTLTKEQISEIVRVIKKDISFLNEDSCSLISRIEVSLYREFLETKQDIENT